MFGVFRLRSGREIVLLSLFLSRPFTPPPPPTTTSPLLLLMMWRTPKEILFLFSLSPFLALLFCPLPQIFHLDLIPVLSLGDTIGPRDLSMGPRLSNRGDHFGSCYVLWGPVYDDCEKLNRLSRIRGNYYSRRRFLVLNAVATNNLLSTFRISP